MSHRSHSSSSFIQATTIAGVLWLVAFLVLFIRGLRAADELERRIQGEALAIAYPLVLVLPMTLALMELAVGLKSGTGRTSTSASSYRSSI